MFILLAILLLFGPKKIPEVMQMFGKGMREFRKAQENLRQQIRDISTEVDTVVQSPPGSKNLSYEMISAPDATAGHAPAPESVPDEIDPAHTTLPMNFHEAPNETPPENTAARLEIRPADSIVSRASRRETPKNNLSSGEESLSGE